MLYLLKWNKSDLIYVIFGIAIVCIYFILRNIKKLLKNTNNIKNKQNSYYFAFVITLMLFVFLNLIFYGGIGKKIYYMNLYKHEDYKSVEGEIQNFEYIYANNSYNVRGRCFEVKDNQFEINKGIVDSGYSYIDNIINRDGQKFKIYFVEPRNSEKINMILRIDELLIGGE